MDEIFVNVNWHVIYILLDNKNKFLKDNLADAYHSLEIQIEGKNSKKVTFTPKNNTGVINIIMNNEATNSFTSICAALLSPSI